MKKLFEFVEILQTLGASKAGMTDGDIPFSVLQKTGFKPLEILRYELLKSREIQIPLYCGQKMSMTEEEALCSLDLILKNYEEQRQH